MITKKFNQKKLPALFYYHHIGFKVIYKHVKLLNLLVFFQMIFA